MDTLIWQIDPDLVFEGNDKAEENIAGRRSFVIAMIADGVISELLQSQGFTLGRHDHFPDFLISTTHWMKPVTAPDWPEILVLLENEVFTIYFNDQVGKEEVVRLKLEMRRLLSEFKLKAHIS